EYAAIFLAGRIRKLPVNISVGLSGDIFESSSYEREDQASVGDFQINQNKEDGASTENQEVSSEIILSNGLELENYKIEKYLGLSHQNYYFSYDDLIKLKSKTKVSKEVIKTHSIPEYLKEFFGLELGQESIEFQARFKVEFNQIFQGLVAKMSDSATHAGANALLGLQFQITPMNDGDEKGFILNSTATMVKTSKL
ncbi:hypothetical protein N9O57_02260, partial [bacterium]|nr:hypothetical protein [bacterium]